MSRTLTLISLIVHLVDGLDEAIGKLEMEHGLCRADYDLDIEGLKKSLMAMFKVPSKAALKEVRDE